MRLNVRLPSWPRVRLGVRARLVLSFLVVTLPALLFVLASDYRHYGDQREARLAQTQALAGAARSLLQAEMDQAAAAARQALASTSAGEPAGTGARLHEIIASQPSYLDAFVVDEQGRLFAAAPARPLALDRGALARAASSANPVVSDLLLSPPDERPAFQILVRGDQASASSPIAGITLDAQALGRKLTSLVEGTSLSVVVCDSRGWSVASSFDAAMPWEQRDWSIYAHIQQALQGQAAKAGRIVSHLDGRSYAGTAVPMPGTGWAVSVWQPEPDVLLYLRDCASIGIFLVVGLVLAALIAAGMLERWFTSPLVRLAEHARALGRGQLNERIAMDTGDELEQLAAALNGMARQMEERDRRLRARTAELDAVITQSADGIAIHGPGGELLRLNPAGARILGCTPARMGQSLAEQVAQFRIRTAAGTPLDPADLPVATALRGETCLAQELRVNTNDGEERFIDVSAAPLSDARGQIYGAVTIFRDVTVAHQSQQEKDDFISLVSHELKTPITSIKGYAQMLQRRVEQTSRDPKDLKGLRIINDEVDRMVELINQLLDVSRLDTQRLQLDQEPVDLAFLAADAVDRMQMTTTRHTLRLRAPQHPIWVEADAMRLTQVLGNLIMNAIKYSPAGGPVEISLESQEDRGWLSVRDWGIGIALEDQAHVFQRFYRGSRRGAGSMSGMGLGLYISREIIQRHGGDIVFHSQPGQGTTFLFWLPLARAPEGSTAARQGEASAEP